MVVCAGVGCVVLCCVGEEPLDCVWDHWTGNRNSGMDAVAQPNSIDKTQLINDHRRQPKKKTCKSEPNSRLNEIGLQGDAIWIQDCRYNSSVTRTQISCSKVRATGLAMGRLHFSRQWRLSMGLLVYWMFLMIIQRQIEAQMIKSRSFAVREVKLSTYRSEKETQPQPHCS